MLATRGIKKGAENRSCAPAGTRKGARPAHQRRQTTQQSTTHQKPTRACTTTLTLACWDTAIISLVNEPSTPPQPPPPQSEQHSLSDRTNINRHSKQQGAHTQLLCSQQTELARKQSPKIQKRTFQARHAHRTEVSRYTLLPKR